jgi:hypothetical protein
VGGSEQQQEDGGGRGGRGYRVDDLWDGGGGVRYGDGWHAEGREEHGAKVGFSFLHAPVRVQKKWRLLRRCWWCRDSRARAPHLSSLAWSPPPFFWVRTPDKTPLQRTREYPVMMKKGRARVGNVGREGRGVERQDDIWEEETERGRGR